MKMLRTLQGHIMDCFDPCFPSTKHKNQKGKNGLHLTSRTDNRYTVTAIYVFYEEAFNVLVHHEFSVAYKVRRVSIE